nr:MAG TPA: hypothetical protein [Caudoviricetes sp.]
MADNPITTPLPADLPTDWVYGQTIGPQGTDVGLTQQHGYNYLMQQVNAAQQAATQIGQAFSGLPTLGSDGKIPASQLPAMNYDPAGSAAAVQTNLTDHINNKNNPHGVTAAQVGAIPTTGGSVSGALNFANNVWNNVGDDAAFGDRNVAGNFCIKGLNGAPGITLFTSDESQSYQVFGQHNLSLLMSQLAANGGCRIASGSYVGVNTEKHNGPAKVFNLPFAPKALIITINPGGDSVDSINSGPQIWVALNGMTYANPTYASGNQEGRAQFSWDGTTVTVSGYDRNYPNWNGSTYYWIALG